MIGLDEDLEECGKCGKVITGEEFVVNWGTCDVCFDANFDEYLHDLHLRLQLKD